MKEDKKYWIKGLMLVVRAPSASEALKKLESAGVELEHIEILDEEAVKQRTERR